MNHDLGRDCLSSLNPISFVNGLIRVPAVASQCTNAYNSNLCASINAAMLQHTRKAGTEVAGLEDDGDHISWVRVVNPCKTCRG